MLRSVVSLAASLSLGCVGYSDTSPPLTGAGGEDMPRELAERDAQADRLLAEDAALADAGRDDGDSDLARGDVEAVEDVEAVPQVPANLRIGHSARFASYLMDEDGRPLYMFAEDIAGSGESACLDTCAKEWPPFEQPALALDPEIIRNEVTRFHRQDGRWQSAYKGHPLYYRARELGTREISGDGVEGVWFVARDYLAFVSVDHSFAPAGSDTFDAGFLTNGFGRALYVCFDDTPADADGAPVSSCLGDCVRRRPLWSASERVRTSILPSVMDPDDLSEFLRPDGAVQLVFRGWPVYYFSGDEKWGDTQGQNQEAWRAIDPVGFGKQVATQGR
jgi:predicted lipoprotein with Yx(FWY)xxD motif